MSRTSLSDEDIFQVARRIGIGEARTAYLNQACGENVVLRREVEELLGAHDESQSFLESPASEIEQDAGRLATQDQCPPEKLGTLIGPYKLLEQIGEGGFGVVFMAEQIEPVRRKVALKVLKAGMDTRQVVARFEAERQALAIMDHPNIARVFDGGATPTGRPFFVMELVRGVPITEYCDQNHLTPRERLELFATVCYSVQHAHQKGIIHRDLKPSNVMVSRHDTTPIVKIIDFGVAKALGQNLTEKTLFTGIAQMIGTPLYMSPEQAGMSDLDVDTRSDIYSLGVLLYELLTGTTPFDKDRLKSVTFDELRRIIREEEPETVSQRLAKTRRVGPARAASAGPPIDSAPATSHQPLDTRLSELDWIVMKSLEKDRSRRYESASALAADIHRYLSDEPVLACPPTTMYRFQKFARKHKASLSTAAAIALCLILGTTVSAWQAVRATTAEAQANANEQKAVANEQKANTERDEVKALADKLAAKEQQLQRTLYAAHMNLAHNAFEAGAPARLRELLAQHRPHPGEPDLRGFEWHYLNRLVAADVLVLKHTERVLSVAYSPDGKRLATTSQGGAFTMWDAQTGDKLYSHQEIGGGGNTTATFSPDSKRVASNGNRGTVKVWDAETGQELLSLRHKLSEFASSLLSNPVFSPDGKRLATTSRNQLIMWDAQSGQLLLSLEGHSAQIRGGLAYSPDGKRLASASADKTVKLWDALTGQILQTLEHEDGLLGIAFSPDSRRLASASMDKTVKIWDPLSGQIIRTLRGHTGGVFGVAFSPDGKRLASGSLDSSVKVWDVESGGEIFTLRGHTKGVWSVAFSPDGQRLASASEDGSVKVRKAKAVEGALALGGGATDVTLVAFSLDGKRLTSVNARGSGVDPSKAKAQVWNTQTGEPLLAIDAGNGNPDVSLDGRRLAGGSTSFEGQLIRGSEAYIWDLLTGEKLRTIPNLGMFTDYFALSPDGSRLFITTNRPVNLPGASRNAKAGQLIDANTGQQLLSVKDPVNKMVFSPDGKRLAGISPDKRLMIWNTQTGEEIGSFKGAADSVAFSTDGNRLASGSDDATVAKVWHAQTGEELLSLQGHSGAITSVAFSPDDKRLATTSSDATIKVWDGQTGQELLTLAGHSGRDNGVAFSPDGHRLAAGGPNGAVLIYDATPLPEKP